MSSEKNSMCRLILALIFATCASFAGVKAFAAQTTSSDLRMLEEKLHKADASDETSTLPLVKSVSDAVRNMPKSTENKKLDTVQVRELVQILRASEKVDLYHRILDDNVDLIKANKREIGLELKKLSPAEAKEVAENIAIVMGSEGSSDFWKDEGGQPIEKKKHKK